MLAYDIGKRGLVSLGVAPQAIVRLVHCRYAQSRSLPAPPDNITSARRNRTQRLSHRLRTNSNYRLQRLPSGSKIRDPGTRFIISPPVTASARSGCAAQAPSLAFWAYGN